MPYFILKIIRVILNPSGLSNIASENIKSFSNINDKRYLGYMFADRIIGKFLLKDSNNMTSN